MPQVPPPQLHESPRQGPLRWGKWLALLLWTAIAAGSYALYLGLIQIPQRLNPWAPLDVMAAPNFLTSYKLSRTQTSPALCLNALTESGMRFEVLPNRSTGPGCGFTNAVLLRSAGVRLGSPLALSCPMAVAFFMWEKHGLQPAAQRVFGRNVAAIEHLGSYACRNINRGEGTTERDEPGARSQHATADALDIAAITLADGKRISVLGQWKRDDPQAPPNAEALLLAEAHREACRFFKGVFGPDYNAAHKDHLHLETGGYRMCR